MRLKTIKLAGFKSFVDSTSIPVSSNLIGIVGPNGCGKSNIIDAVRWVMGESSARHLRGDSMADVIFNGSSARKPVGQASVELVFDNGDGSAGGQFARYTEISIRREAARDGRSEYFLNKTRCRRKDITDLLLGTGLGPRAYSIIEQDMVSRVVEAKPEELRAFFEEAAGISKYRERRRETETRMRHARENLARVEDIRQELETQLRRLKRQSRAAARYKELKAEERRARAEWLALRWRTLDVQVQQADRSIATHDVEFERALAEQRATEATIEKIRNAQADAAEHFNQVQGQFYSVGAEIAGLEQAIEHARERHQQRLRELEQLNQAWNEASAHLRADLERMRELGSALEQGAGRLAEQRRSREQGMQALHDTEAAMSAWQNEWDQFTEAAAEPEKMREIQRARRAQLEPHIGQLQARGARLAAELEQIRAALAASALAELHAREQACAHTCAEGEHELDALEVRLKELRAREGELGVEAEELRGEQQHCDSRLASLRALQSAAEGRDDAALGEWLAAHGLERAPRLAALLAVEPGWERAVETVLGAQLAAVCVERLERLALALEGHTDLHLALLAVGENAAAPEAGSRPTLLGKVKASADLAPLLAGIYVSPDLPQALAMRAQLATRELVVTPEGVLVGRNWLRLAGAREAQAGMIGREREIEQCSTESDGLQQRLQALLQARTALRAELVRFEGERDSCRTRLHIERERLTALRAERAQQDARCAQLAERTAQIEREQQEMEAQLERERRALAEADELLQQAEGQSDQQQRRRGELIERRDASRARLEQARREAVTVQETLHALEMERERLQAALDSTRASTGRLEGQLKQLTDRREELRHALAGQGEPGAELRERLNTFLQERVQVEQRLNAARTEMEGLEGRLRASEQDRADQGKRVQEIRELHEEGRVRRQELLTRRDGLAEQVTESGFALADVVAGLPAQATEEAWQACVQDLGARIERLGAINLVAIEEYQEQSQRKAYLDKQHQDLSEALAMLEEAIRKMDRETRARFKETFDRVNAGFQAFFPRLFGGGSAYLELTEGDLLTTGVTVMARPPGKRNSTIHLLSGGEKALTAVALLFSLFELNPAPFCLLDEVDAPLDDANVERYCETLATLSHKTQLIYVTHNKISMETANVLIGVTMTEPGVSRLVAVDVDEALQMAAR